MVACIPDLALGQVGNPLGYFADESKLALYPSTTIVADPTAEGGNAIFKGVNTPSETIWYGPYVNLQAGNYMVQIRLKVSSNSSNTSLFFFDAVSNLGSTIYARLTISPNMFRNSNEWQLFTVPIELPENVSGLELRGMNFQSGITDVWFDYIQILPGDLRGNYSNEFTITGKGEVGIGTSDTKGHKLAVAGSIVAESVKVALQPNWPDYVFHSSYKLPDLKEVEQFIKENKHLPEIPSAAEVEKEGINLGEMNANLLKKIEELTLYVIDLKKENESQNQKILELQKSNRSKR